MEHPGELSNEDIRVLGELAKKLESVSALIAKVENGITMIENLDNIAKVLESKCTDRDFGPSYDDDPDYDHSNLPDPFDEERKRLEDALIY